jgi:hypothetical protein
MPDRLDVIPNPIRLVRALARPNKRFVMVNLLRFKTRATGRHRGISGRDAYFRYAESVKRVQGQLGSRMIWAGEVRDPGTGPTFHVIALLEYRSPAAFVRFATTRGVDHRARKDGLEGQWLFSATTIDEAETPPIGEHVLVELGAARQTGSAPPLWSGQIDRHILGDSAHRLSFASARAFDGANALETARSRSAAAIACTAHTLEFEI